jgi:hypothetical protein
MHGRIKLKLSKTCTTNSSHQWSPSKALSNKISTGLRLGSTRV